GALLWRRPRTRSREAPSPSRSTGPGEELIQVLPAVVALASACPEYQGDGVNGRFCARVAHQHSSLGHDGSFRKLMSQSSRTSQSSPLELNTSSAADMDLGKHSLRGRRPTEVCFNPGRSNTPG